MRASVTSQGDVVIPIDASQIAYTFGLWVQGNPVTVDPDPNVTPPAANRIYTLRPEAVGAFISSRTPGLLRAIAIGGTSLTYQGWFYNTQRAAWVTWGTATTITLATTNVGIFGNSLTLTAAHAGARFCAQITAQVGGVTAFGLGLT